MVKGIVKNDQGGDGMDDLKIVNMLVSRDENGLIEAEKQYGKLCHYIANNILKSPPDAQECVNDTLLRTWNSIPPNIPDRLGAYISKIARNVALDKYNSLKSEKRLSNDGAIPLSELEGVLPDNDSLVEAVILKACINTFLRSLSKEKRAIFIQRYFYSSEIKEIAIIHQRTESNIKVILLRLRQAFEKHIKKYGLEGEK